MASLTSEIVFSRYSNFTSMYPRFGYLLDAYMGAGGFDDGSYLDYHPREAKFSREGTFVEYLPKFKMRKARAYYYNIIKTVVDVPVSYIFQAPIMRTGHKMFEDFAADCNGRGTSLNLMMEELTRYARVFGSMFFVIDKNPGKANNRADDLKNKPKLIPVFPSDVCDYFMEDGVLKWVKILERYETSDGPLKGKQLRHRVRVWDEQNWYLYAIEAAEESIQSEYANVKAAVPKPSAEAKATETARGTHGLGYVPFVGIYNQQPEFGEIFGTTDIFQSARVARRIFNLCSELDEILRDQTFSLLVIPTDSTEDTANQVTGTTNGMYYKPVAGAAGLMPTYISPDAKCADTISTNIEALRSEIYRAASMGYAEGVMQVRSGVSKQWNFDQTNRFLSGLARRCESAEKQAGKLALLWMGVKPQEKDVQVQYPGTFNISDLMEEIEITDAIIAMRISKKFATKVAEDLVRKRFPSATKEELDEIFKEIAASDMIDPPPTAMVGPTSSLAAGASLQARVRAKRGMAMSGGGKQPLPTMSTGRAARIPTPQAPALDSGA